MNFIFEKNINYNLWDELLSHSLYANPFQTPDFYNYFNSIPNNRALVLALEESFEYKVLAVITIQKEKGIKGYFSRRAIIYGGLVTRKENENHIAVFIKQLHKTLKNKAIYIEIRNNFSYHNYVNLFLENKWQYLQYLNYQIHVNNKSPHELLNLMPYNRRREIKMSLNEGVKFHQTVDSIEMHSIYDILYELYQTRVKKPLPDFSFFKKIADNKQGLIFAVTHNNKIIGGSFSLFLPEKNIYTWYYCGLRDYSAKIFPTHIAVWAVINFAAERNLQLVDLMGAGRADEPYGVRDYKAKFGGNLVEDGRFLKIINPFLFKIGKLGLKALSIIKSK